VPKDSKEKARAEVKRAQSKFAGIDSERGSQLVNLLPRLSFSETRSASRSRPRRSISERIGHGTPGH
jgi:hypothetical protein